MKNTWLAHEIVTVAGVFRDIPVPVVDGRKTCVLSESFPTTKPSTIQKQNQESGFSSVKQGISIS